MREKLGKTDMGHLQSRQNLPSDFSHEGVANDTLCEGEDPGLRG